MERPVSAEKYLHRPRYLCLTGPTAAGKTAAALAIACGFASHIKVEIVSVDSALVYRGMDIGTAKPTAKELEQVPHHLISILDPAQAYSAAQFVKDARGLVEDIESRGGFPLLVGGTMLYFKALFDGLDDMPPSNPAIRAELQEQATKQGWTTLYQELQRVDPQSAARLVASDTQRIGRALEVFRISGQPLSTFHTLRSRANNRYPIRDYEIISMEPENRSWLHERIARRFEAMLEMGFLQEVHALRQRGDLSPDLPSMRCVGYRQAWTYLAAQAADPKGSSQALALFMAQGIAATRQLAKRQITWLRAIPQRHAVKCDAPDALHQVLKLAKSFTGFSDKGHA